MSKQGVEVVDGRKSQVEKTYNVRRISNGWIVEQSWWNMKTGEMRKTETYYPKKSDIKF